MTGDSPVRTPRRPSLTRILGSAALWLLVGALVGFGIAGILTVGSFLLATAVVLFVVGVAVPAIDRRTVPTMLIGVATAPCYIAWLNRRGPGEICMQSTGGMSCVEQWDPLPFVTAGIALALAGLALTWLALRPTTDRHPSDVDRLR